MLKNIIQFASVTLPLLATAMLGAGSAAFAAESTQPTVAPQAAPTLVQRNPSWPDLEEIIVTWKCHLDIGFTKPVPEVIADIRARDMDQLLAMFEKTKNKPEDERFRWMWPAWAMEIGLDQDQDPVRRAKLEQAVKDGRLLWQAFPYTFESDGADLEELVRGLGCGSRLSRRFGLPLSTEAKQTDMPEQAWVLPTLLANAGVKFIHIGSNDASKPPAEWVKIPTLCWWEGADGSRVLLGYSSSYGWASILPPKGWMHKTWLAFFVRVDNSGPPSPEEVEGVLAQARKQFPGVKVRFGRPGDFADAIIAEEKVRPTLPVIRADMPDTWCHGQMSTPEATAIHRRAAPMLGTLGQLDTTLIAFGLAPEPVAPLLDDGYKNGGFYAEHTWGLDGKKFSGKYGQEWKKKYDAGDYRLFEATYDWHMNYGRKAMADAKGGIAPRMGLLARAVGCEGPRVVAFNPLPWVRDAQVEVELPKSIAVSAVTDAVSGQPVAFEQAESVLRMNASALPPGGYKTFALKTGGTTATAQPVALTADGVLKTVHFTVKFDLVRGGIASLVENATGRELVAQGGKDGHALGQFLHERFDLDRVWNFVHTYSRPSGGKNNWWFPDFGKPGMPNSKESPYAAMTPKDWTAAVTQGPLGAEVRLTPADTLGLAKAFELAFAFPKAKACVDITWRVAEKTADPIPEGGWICLPFNVEKPAFRIGRVGGTIDPAKDIGFGASRSLITVDRGITVRSGLDAQAVLDDFGTWFGRGYGVPPLPEGAGVGVASADLPLWSLGKPGLWLYEPAYVPEKPELFVNLYNNMWNVNYPRWVGGSWKVALRIWPVAAGVDEEKAHFTPAWELRQGAVAAFADGKGGALPTMQAGVSLSRKGTRITAFCPNPDAENGVAGTLLRVWEQAGVNGEITVTLPTGFKAAQAQPVNLRGEKTGKPVKIEGGRFSFNLGHCAPASFILE